jgi:hypothetical protein
VRKIDDKITSLHSFGLAETRATVERLETSARKNSVDPENRMVPDQEPGRGLTRKEVRAQVQERLGEYFDRNRGVRLCCETTAWQAYQAERIRRHGAARQTSVHDVRSVPDAPAPSPSMDKQATRASPKNAAAANPAAPAAQPDQAPKHCTSAQVPRDPNRRATRHPLRRPQRPQLRQEDGTMKRTSLQRPAEAPSPQRHPRGRPQRPSQRPADGVRRRSSQQSTAEAPTSPGPLWPADPLARLFGNKHLPTHLTSHSAATRRPTLTSSRQRNSIRGPNWNRRH